MKKIPYNKDEDRPNIKTELRRELGWVIEGAEKKTGEAIKKYPYPIFWIMVAIIIISFILRFTILTGSTHKETNKPVLVPAYQELKKNSIQNIPSNPLEKLQKMVDLRTKVEALMRRGNLSRADSLFIINAEETIKKIKDEKN